MEKCKKCNALLDDGASFCAICGEECKQDSKLNFFDKEPLQTQENQPSQGRPQ
ncbi:MAG: zinc-ribbon domain-containing protein, partial [Thermoguttaceae bacterium]|nr:zinc-ribbon domain-containing protein [Thermoguttaceae bacterium]